MLLNEVENTKVTDAVKGEKSVIILIQKNALGIQAQKKALNNSMNTTAIDRLTKELTLKFIIFSRLNKSSQEDDVQSISFVQLKSNARNQKH